MFTTFTLWSFTFKIYGLKNEKRGEQTKLTLMHDKIKPEGTNVPPILNPLATPQGYSLNS